MSIQRKLFIESVKEKQIMAHKTVKEAIGQSKELERIRSGEEMIPPPNYDIALTLYERNPDGTDADQGHLSFGFRPQDFATNPHMKYTRFGSLKTIEREGKSYMVAYLIHLYWDGSRDEESAIQAVLEMSHLFGYGEWNPTAPSDPLMQDDFWDEKLGDPPNGLWDEWYEMSGDDYPHDFTPFNNFGREPYEKVSLGGND